MEISHGEENVMSVAKKVIALIDIQTMNNGKQKNFGDKTKNSVEVKANRTYFSRIMKGIQMMILIMSIKKQII